MTNSFKSLVKNTIKNSLPDVGRINSEARDLWLKKTLESIPKGQRILDAGAGELRYKKYCSHLSYVSQDFGQYDGQGDNKGLQVGSWDQTKIDLICDIIDIPEPDNSFDVIMCIEVFEHLPDPLLAIKEFTRLLRKHGTLIITAPFCSLTHFAPYHFSSGFNIYWYEKHLKDYGYKIIQIEKNGNFFEYLAQELLRLDLIARKYSCGKLSLYDKTLLFFLLRKLKTLSKNDSGSQEVLYYGCHVLAEKI